MLPGGASFSIQFRMNVILEDGGKIGEIRVFKATLTTYFNLGARRED